jgi:hypothetical protein
MPHGTVRAERRGGLMSEPTKPPDHLTFHYIKGSQFRVVHSDGIIGGLTPRGLIHVAFYSERPAIPQLVVQDVTPEGKLGKETSRVGKEGIARELEVDVMLDEDTAKALHEWLGQRLQELSTAKARTKGQGK